MKWFLNILLFLPGTLCAQLEIIPAKETPLLFAGKEQSIEIVFKNPTDKPILSEVHTQLFQASSASLMPTAPSKLWKQLQVLPRQTVIEKISVDVPAVRGITEFRVRFSENGIRIGNLKVRAVPGDLLKQLSDLTGKIPVGIFDPDNQLKPLLQKNKVEFQDLENGAGFDGFTGKLAIIGPFRSQNSVPANLQKRIAAQREKPLAILWIQPPESKSDPLLPLYFVRNGQNNIAVVNATVIAGLAATPKSQLGLVHAAELALNPALIHFPVESQ